MAALENDSMGSGAAYPTESKLVLNARAEGLNVEIVGPISLFPDGEKCGIHFGADATVTVMLGMRDYGHGYASPYFASLVAARLGIPFKRIRLYYGGVHPAVKIAPWRTPNVPSRSSVGIANAEIGDLIESLCDQAIEQGRRCLASSIGVPPGEIDFEAPCGRFFAVGKERHVDILELAKKCTWPEATSQCRAERDSTRRERCDGPNNSLRSQKHIQPLSRPRPHGHSLRCPLARRGEDRAAGQTR